MGIAREEKHQVPAKTLVYGCTGFLSKAFISELRNRNMDFLSISRSDIDMTNFKSVSKFLAEEEFNSIFLVSGQHRAKLSKCTHKISIY